MLLIIFCAHINYNIIIISIIRIILLNNKYFIHLLVVFGYVCRTMSIFMSFMFKEKLLSTEPCCYTKLVHTF